MTGLHKHYELAGAKVEVLADFTADFPKEQITVVLGKSGCGKTTLIRLIAGLEDFESGSLEGPPPEKIGMVFQEPRLMPWLTVQDNITFGVKKAKLDQQALVDVIKLVNLAGFEDAYPHQLSGGMQQRSALARALMYDPEVILMDEPFSSLDYFIREAMQQKIIEIYQSMKKSIVFVTHSVDEALILGHKIIVVGSGQVTKEYDLSKSSYPRDVLSEEMIAIKKDILCAIKSEDDQSERKL